MATTFYVYSGATGLNNGTTTDDAWVSIASAIAALGTTIAAGDIIKVRGTQNVGMVDINGKTNTGKFYKFIGVNASWVDDGTKAIITANGAAAYAMRTVTSACSGFYFKNFGFTGGTSGGWNTSIATTHFFFDNCSFYSNTGVGLEGASNLSACILYKCSFYSNTTVGFRRFGNNTIAVLVHSYSNGAQGASCNGGNLIVINGIFRDNTADAVLVDSSSGSPEYFINCVADGNGQDGFDVNATSIMFFALLNRITYNTNNAIDIAAASARGYEDYNYNSNNGGGIVDNATDALIIGGNSVATGTPGYVDRANKNYTTGDTATSRRIAITMPVT